MRRRSRLIFQDIHVGVTRENFDQYGVGWRDQDGNRWHVWCDRDGVVQPQEGDTGKMTPALYKNPPLGLTRGDIRYFDTKVFNASAKVHASAVNHVLFVVMRKDLLAKAIEQLRVAATEEREKNLERARIEQIKEAGPELYRVAQLVVGFFEGAGPNMKTFFGQPGEALLLEARNAIDTAEGR